MAARLIDDDPERAHAHALAASRSAGRIAIVRETVAITAYALGDFALAVRELRTYRRISAVTTRSLFSSTVSAGSAGPIAPSRWGARLIAPR